MSIMVMRTRLSIKNKSVRKTTLTMNRTLTTRRVMMSKSYIEDSILSAELEESLGDSKVYPLAQELNHLYGMKVTSQVAIRKDMYGGRIQYGFCDKDKSLASNTTISKIIDDGFVLSHDGIPSCVVYHDDDVYHMYVPYIIKERGKDTWDRKTISSIKISQIIKTLTKKKFTLRHTLSPMPLKYTDMAYVHGQDGKLLGNKKRELIDHQNTLNYGSNRKEYMIALIDKVYNGAEGISHDADNFFKEYIDKANKMNQDIKSHSSIAHGDIRNGFTAIGVTRSDGYIVGKVSHNDSEFELTDTQCLRSLDQLSYYDSLKPMLTMLKLRLEDEGLNVDRDYFLQGNDRWDESLGIYFTNVTRGDCNYNPFDIRWTLLPNLKDNLV